MNKKVFIPSIPTRWDAATESRVPSVDLNPAAKFGDLIAMSTGIGTMHDQIEEVARKAQDITDADYILCVGDVVLTAVAISAADRRLGTITLLRWNKTRHAYNEVVVKL